MRKIPLVLALLAGATLWATYSQWAKSTAVTPEILLASAADRVRDTDEPDYDAALYELGRALQMAERSGEPERVEEVLLARADMLRTCGALEPAIADYERLVHDFRPEDPGLDLILSGLYQREGDRETALRLVEEVLAEAKLHSGAWVQLGSLHAERAEETFGQVLAILHRALPEQGAARGRDLALRIASRDLRDPSRVALTLELRDLFGLLGNRDSDLALSLLREASAGFGEAREAYTRAFQRRANPQAMTGFLELLVGAGRFEEAATFGFAALAHDAIRRDRQAVVALVRALAGVGNLRETADLVRRNLGLRLSFEETLEWCRLLYDAEAWEPLTSLARNFSQRIPAGVDHEELQRAAAFYLAIGEYRRGSRKAAGRLGVYLRMVEDVQELPAPVPETIPRLPELDQARYEPVPFEGADVEAHLAMAAVRRGARQAPKELESLRAAAAIGGDLPGAVYARIHELEQGRKVSALQRVRTLTHALRLLGDPDGTRTRDWHRLGRAALGEDKKDPVHAGAPLLREDSQWYPEGQVEPYELYALARDHRSSGHSQGAVVCLRLLLEDYPHLQIAQDELIELYVEAERWSALPPLLLDRIERWGSSPELVALLRDLPDDVLTLDQHLARMRLDPLHSGVFAMAEILRDRGEYARALGALGTTPIETLGSPGRLLAGEILLGAEQYSAAVGVLFPIRPSDPLFSRASALRIEAALASDDEELLMGAVREVGESPELDVDEILGIVDELVRGGHRAPADLLLARLDSSPRTRGGRVFLRQASAHLLAGELEDAEEDLVRAEAYLAGATPLLGRVLLATERRDWKAIPPELRRLRETDWNPTPLQMLCVLALEDRLEEARELLDGHLEKGRPPVEWLAYAATLSTLQGLSPPGLPFGQREDRVEVLHFVAGVPGYGRDARQTAVLLLALEDPFWRRWVPRRLDALQIEEHLALQSADEGAQDAAGDAAWTAADGVPRAENPWYPYLRAVAHRGLDDVERAAHAAQEALRVRETFAAAWDVLEELAVEAAPRRDDPSVLALRQERREALELGEEVLAEGLLLEAQQLALAGELDDAIAKAQWAVREDRGLVSARLLLTRLQVQAGHYQAAQANFERLFRELPREEAFELVPEYVRALDRFIERKTTTPLDASRELASLRSQLPLHPDLALALARMEMRSVQGNVEAGTARVWRRLQELRERAAPRPLEELAPGAMRRWFDFALELDARRTERLVRDELRLRPESPDLWLMLGEALEAQYRVEEALAQYRALLALFPEKQVLRRATSLMAQVARSPQEVEDLLYESIDLHDWKVDDPVVRAMLARAYASGSAAHRDTAIELFAGLWEEREALDERTLHVVDLGEQYGAALLRRGYKADRQRAQEVYAAVEPKIVDGPRRDLCRALGFLAQFLPSEAPADAVPAEEAGARRNASRSGAGSREAAAPPAGAAPERTARAPRTPGQG